LLDTASVENKILDNVLKFTSGIVGDVSVPLKSDVRTTIFVEGWVFPDCALPDVEAAVPVFVVADVQRVYLDCPFVSLSHPTEKYEPIS
jgi:hypothetical protein